MREIGGAEPPEQRRVRLDRSYRSGSASSRARTPCQIVGTPAEMVTDSDTMRSRSLSGVMKRCGMTCFAPSMVAVYGRPQPIAWNIGTMPQVESAPERLMTSVIASHMVWR